MVVVRETAKLARLIRRPGSWVGLMVLLLVAVGCRTAVQTVRTQPAPSRSSLEQEGVVLAAVTALGGGEYVAADALGEVVLKQFREARPWLKLLPLEQARLAMTQSRHEDLMKKVAKTGRWTDEHFASLAALTNIARYALVVDVARSQESQTVYRNYQEEYLYHGAVATPMTYEVVSGGRRTVTLVFYLRDLQTGKTVWVTSGTAMRRAFVRQSGYEHLYRPAPPAGIPSVVEVSETIARQVARRLPK
ncbi:hypothetical protein NXS98_08460 [Fontisphaera persica]|uniref:hypothetical protein n=1 Tax=Fontisphaera persica TaxID=2974023 RepID=UPI0024C04C67|nr:hypothetical protein [Fontisphaera persica]WCJ61140.1 hypothetical protein NXS98_08460 [Fontisphaera persica]